MNTQTRSCITPLSFSGRDMDGNGNGGYYHEGMRGERPLTVISAAVVAATTLRVDVRVDAIYPLDRKGVD